MTTHRQTTNPCGWTITLAETESGALVILENGVFITGARDWDEAALLYLVNANYEG